MPIANPSKDTYEPESQSERPQIPKEIWVLVAAFFLVALGYGLIAPLLPQFVVSFDVGMAAAGAVISVFSVSRLIFATGAGILADKLGVRRVYITGLLLVAINTGLISIAQEYWQILLLRFLAGIGSTMFTVSAMGLIVKLAPPEIRGKCSATYATSFLLGSILGPLVGSALAFLGFRWPFLIYGIGLCFAAVVVWALMPRMNASAQQPTNDAKITYREAMQDTAFRSVLVSNFAHGWVNMGVRVAVIPLFAAAIFTDSAAAAGYALAAYAAGNAIVLQFSGRLADRIGRKPMIMVGFAASALCVGLYGTADTLWLLLVLSTLSGAAAGIAVPAQQATLADVIGNERSGGKVLAAFQMAMDLGMIFGPLAIGAAADNWGFTWAFLLSAGVAALAFFAWIPGRETLLSRDANLQEMPVAR
ncbi:MFS transporter [Corynebacterium pseudodiphtheriticum]|uniref:MFS transporter n=1 Tax=Corynebacterium pseudodiphtheriticum TaxID=37637 RepID=UPI002543EC66|nr:MFS transporter [Corynebacterium pseudodiphtheriticum]MDK4241071.1 MFS transporter [Corynebacterium pseudodiphtheriticum]